MPCFLENGFEPFVVVRRCAEPTAHNGSTVVPRFDERYFGYGKNKIQWIAALRGGDYEFHVVRDAFAVHVPHKDSAAKKSWDRAPKILGRAKKSWNASAARAPRPNRVRKEGKRRVYFSTEQRAYVEGIFRDQIRALGLYDDAHRANDLPDAAYGLNEDKIVTPHCAALPAHVAAIESDHFPAPLNFAAHACLTKGQRHCGSLRNIADQRDRWEAIARDIQTKTFASRLREARLNRA